MTTWLQFFVDVLTTTSMSIFEIGEENWLKLETWLWVRRWSKLGGRALSTSVRKTVGEVSDIQWILLKTEWSPNTTKYINWNRNEMTHLLQNVCVEALFSSSGYLKIKIRRESARYKPEMFSVISKWNSSRDNVPERIWRSILKWSDLKVRVKVF